MNISPSWKAADTRWYLGVHCSECQTPILFGLDHSDGSGSPQYSGKLVLTCSRPECRHQDDYSEATIFRFQKNPPNKET